MEDIGGPLSPEGSNCSDKNSRHPGGRNQKEHSQRPEVSAVEGEPTAPLVDHMRLAILLYEETILDTLRCPESPTKALADPGVKAFDTDHILPGYVRHVR